MIAIPLGVVLIYFIMQSLTVDEAAHRNLVADGQLMADIRKRSFPKLYDTIEANFPEAYAEHVNEIEDIALDTDLSQFELATELMAESDSFVANLRLDNARFLASAGRDQLLDVQRAQLAILKDLSTSPDLCVKVAKDGLGALTRSELGRIDRNLHGRWLVAQVAALAAGRNSPETFEPPTEHDWRIFLRGWRDEEGETTPQMQAYLTADVSDPTLYCEGAVAFARRLIADTTPSGLRILADYSGSTAR